METYRLNSRSSLVSRSSTGAAASTTLGNVGVVWLIGHFIIVGCGCGCGKERVTVIVVVLVEATCR